MAGGGPTRAVPTPAAHLPDCGEPILPESDDSLAAAHPEIDRLRRTEPLFWSNPTWLPAARWRGRHCPGLADVEDAEARWRRFSPLLAERFDELRAARGRIESALQPAPRFAEVLRRRGHLPPGGRVLLKADHALPVAGSVKARGGIYAVLHFAERLALDAGVLGGTDDDYRKLRGDEARALFAGWELTTASTGNLGLSIGIMGSALGFRVTVHMSAEAKGWKKRLLRRRGVEVVEHAGDYISAGAAARAAAKGSRQVHFIDDENSRQMFLGYSVAAVRLRGQLREIGVPVDREHPLLLYLPCGVGGAPGGVTFGARHVFGDDVDCFFAEPVEAPCMLLGMLTGRHAGISVYDIGLAGETDADGLAVSRPSGFVGRLMEPLLSGCYTVTDAQLYRFVVELYESEGIEVEPSAAAGCAGPGMLLGTEAGRAHVERRGLAEHLASATHVIWTTGGRLVPPEQHEAHRRRHTAR